MRVTILNASKMVTHPAVNVEDVASLYLLVHVTSFEPEFTVRSEGDI